MAGVGDVLTIKEVCQCWRKSRSAVRYHLDRDNFRWRYTSAGRILIERDSIISLWGPPLEDLDDSW